MPLNCSRMLQRNSNTRSSGSHFFPYNGPHMKSGGVRGGLRQIKRFDCDFPTWAKTQVALLDLRKKLRRSYDNLHVELFLFFQSASCAKDLNFDARTCANPCGAPRTGRLPRTIICSSRRGTCFNCCIRMSQETGQRTSCWRLMCHYCFSCSVLFLSLCAYHPSQCLNMWHHVEVDCVCLN